MIVKMRLFPYEKVMIAGGRKIWISKHPVLNDFGVRPSHDHEHIEGRFVCLGSPGTGYFSKDSDSDLYNALVAKDLQALKSGYLKYVRGKEFNYDVELAKVDAAMSHMQSVQAHAILESYYNKLRVMIDVDRVYRIMERLKYMVKLSPTKDNISPLSHYKSRLHVLIHELRSSSYDMETLFKSESMRKSYEKLVGIFETTAQSRRVWNMVKGDGGMRMERVFWDLGVFDYLVSNTGTPLMRDLRGWMYFIFPKHLIVARNSTDFDIYDLQHLTFVYRETTQESLVSAVVNQEDLLGRPMGEASIEELGVRWYFMHRSLAFKFVNAMNEYQHELKDIAPQGM